MSVVATAHTAAVDRYRRLLVLGTRESAARKALDPTATLAVSLTDAQIDFMVDRLAARLSKRTEQRPFAKMAIEPIRPLRAHERRYEGGIRRIVLRPLMREIRSGLSTATAAAEAIERLDGVPMTTTRRNGLVSREVARQARRLNGYHRRKLIDTFRAALGVDIRPVLNDAQIRPLMDAWRQENIDLIRTVPERLRDDLRTGINKAFRDKPFDQQELAKVVREKGESAGYNLRRITRDQTNKAVGQLTQARHQQLGISEYEWLTAQDERVRETHAILDGTRQRWTHPPDPGHPGESTQCRCVAIPVIPEAETGVPGNRAGVPQPEQIPPGLASQKFDEGTMRVFDGRTKSWGKHRDFVSYDSEPALKTYTANTNDYKLYNEALRNRRPLTPAQERMHRGLSKLYKPLGESVVTFRGLRGAVPFYTGRRILMRAPTSTSVSPTKAFETFARGDTMLEIHGHPAARAIRTSRFKEFELLYKQGQRLRVIDVLYDVDIRGRRVSKYVIAAIDEGV